MKSAPIPKDEMNRILALADLNLDYSNLTETFSDLAKLAAKVSSSPISLVNLIDNYTVWTVSRYGLGVEQTPREESICQYTILEKDHYEVPNLESDPIFKDEEFVTGDANFRFYFGVPLNTRNHNLGALCVLDNKAKSLSAEKIELLKIIADEIINRLKVLQYIEALRNKVTEVQHTQNKVVHDIRGPIAGIMSLADIINQQGKENDLGEVLEFIELIYKGGKSVLELADDILTQSKNAGKDTKSDNAALQAFKSKLEQLYTPQARGKNIELKVYIQDVQAEVSFQQSKLLQIAGNLISNAIKFTPRFGDVTVVLGAEAHEKENILKISVSDTGNGIEADHISRLLADNEDSTDGTDGEKGYGFGLALIKHLVKGMHGTFHITSEIGKGSKFEVGLPCKKS